MPGSRTAGAATGPATPRVSGPTSAAASWRAAGAGPSPARPAKTGPGEGTVAALTGRMTAPDRTPARFVAMLRQQHADYLGHGAGASCRNLRCGFLPASTGQEHGRG